MIQTFKQVYHWLPTHAHGVLKSFLLLLACLLVSTLYAQDNTLSATILNHPSTPGVPPDYFAGQSVLLKLETSDKTKTCSFVMSVVNPRALFDGTSMTIKTNLLFREGQLYRQFDLNGAQQEILLPNNIVPAMILGVVSTPQVTISFENPVDVTLPGPLTVSRGQPVVTLSASGVKNTPIRIGETYWLSVNINIPKVVRDPITGAVIWALNTNAFRLGCNVPHGRDLSYGNGRLRQFDTDVIPITYTGIDDKVEDIEYNLVALTSGLRVAGGTIRIKHEINDGAPIYVAPLPVGTGSGENWENATVLDGALATHALAPTRPIFMRGGLYSLRNNIIIPRGCRIVGGFNGTGLERPAKTGENASGLGLCGFLNETIIAPTAASTLAAISFAGAMPGDTTWSTLSGIRINPADGPNCFAQGIQLASNVIIEDCIINRTNIAILGAPNDENVLIDRCFIVNNATAAGTTSSIINYLGSNCYLRNSVIAYNIAGANCSVIHMAAPVQPGINNHIINCTIAGNTAVPVMSLLGAPTCQNTIFHKNNAAVNPGVFGNAAIVTNNCYIGADALGDGRINPIGGILTILPDDNEKIFRRMTNATAFDFRLAKNSPMINAGTAINRDALPAGMPLITKDASGIMATTRISGLAIDVGAYEMQLPRITPTTVGRIYVQGNDAYAGWNAALDNNGLSECDGSTWTRALPSIRINEVLNDRSVYEVWIADGNYNFDPVSLTNPICIRGGFEGNESRYNVVRTKSTMIRPTLRCLGNSIISSQVPTAFEHVDFTRVVRGATEPLDKPVQVNPNIPPAPNTFDGGILNYTNGSESYFDECKFDNSAARSGGMLYIQSGSKYTFKKTSFSNAEASARMDIPATGGGGAIFINGTGTLIFDKDCLFEDNFVFHGHGGAIWADGQTTVKLAGKTNTNTATQSGGMLYASGDAVIDVEDFSNSSTVADLRADNGGCFALAGNAKMSIKNSDLSFFSAQTNGGAIHTLSTSPLDIETTSFTENAATLGGAIYSEGAKIITLRNMESILSNSAIISGGFISSIGVGSEIILDGATMLSKNRAVSGGAIFMAGGVLKVSKTEIKENVATGGDGGVLFAQDSVTAEFTDIKDLSNNTTVANGGAFSMMSPNSFITLDTCPVIDGNTSGQNGGAVYSLGRISIKNVNMTNNTATENGGAIYVNPPVLIASSITSSIFTNNSASESGGGLYFEPNPGASLILKDLTFSENEATFDGGAIYTTETLDVDNVNFTNNKATENGGAIYTKNGFKITNPATMTGNTAGENGGFLAQTNDAIDAIEISNTVISGSSAGKNGGALSVSNLISTGLTLANHTAVNGGALYMDRAPTARPGKIDLEKSRIVNNKATESGAIKIEENIAGKIENTLIGFNSADKYSAIESTTDVDINFCTIVMNKSEKSLVATDPAAVKINGGADPSVIKNSIIWGNATPLSQSHDLQVTPQTVSYSAIQTSNRSSIADSTVSVIAMTKDNMVSDKGKNLYGPHFNLTAVEWKNAGYDASRLGDIDVAKKLNFYFEPDALPVNRADSSVAPPLLDINGEARIKQFLPDMGAFESDRKGHCITTLNPSSGVYGSLHAPELVCNEDFPAVGFVNVKAFNDASGNPIILNETSNAGVYKLVPETQLSWSYDAGYFNYEITKRTPVFTATYFLEGMPISNPATEEMTAGENVDFNFVKNSKGEITARYKGIRIPLGSSVTWRSAVEDIGKNTYRFELASDENYTSASIDVDFSGSDPKDGFILIFNGDNLGFVYPETDTSLNFAEANVGRAFWECPNEALSLTLEQIQSNPLNFKMPKKRTVLNAINRDRYVGLVPSGSGSGNSPANKAGGDQIDEMVTQIAGLKTIGMNYVYVDSGTYTAAADSLYGFTVLPNVCLKGETAFSETGSTILKGSSTVDTQTVVNLKGRLEGIQVSGGRYGVDASLSGSSIDSCIITDAKEAGFVAQPNVKISIDASMIVSNIKDGIRLVDAEGSVKNSIIVNNGRTGVAVKSSAIENKIVSMIHCTVANNATELSANRNRLTVANSIVWNKDNVIDIKSPIEVISSAIKETRKTSSNYLLTDAITPDFVSPSTAVGVDSDWLMRNWRLNESSICINRADLNEVSGLYNDFDLNQRVQVGFPDLGAFETDKKGSSRAVISPNTAIYTGNAVALSMKDDADYPGLDKIVTLPDSIVDSGIYSDITPIGDFWKYNKSNITITPADISSVEVSSQTIFSLGSTPLSQGEYTIMATGVNKEDLQGVLDIDKFLSPLDSTTYYPKVNEEIKFEFKTAKNYKPFIGTFTVWVAGPSYDFSLTSKNIEYGSTLGSGLSYTAIEKHSGVDTPITGTLFMTDSDKVLPVGTYIRDVTFKPDSPKGTYNEKVAKSVSITVTPIKIPQNGESLVVQNNNSTYGNILTPELLYTKTGGATEILDTSYFDVTYFLNSEVVDTPIHADKYEMQITSKSTSVYAFDSIKDFLTVDSAPITVEPVAITTVYGTVPTLDSKITGLIGSDTILVTLDSNWTPQANVGSTEFKVTAYADSTRDYNVTVNNPALISITARPFDKSEVSINEPTNLIYNGNAKVVTVSSSTFTITENDYSIVYVDNNNINVGKVEYTVDFKNNFMGRESGAFNIILDSTFNVVFTETMFQYDGTAKEVKYTITGEYEGNPKVNYKTRDGVVVAEPKNAGIYSAELSVKRSGDKDVTIFQTEMVITSKLPVAGFIQNKLEVVEPSDISTHALRVDLNIPIQSKISIPYRLVTNATKDEYEIDQNAFIVSEAGVSGDIILTLKNDGKRMPTRSFQIELLSVEGGGFSIDENNKIYSVIMTDNGDFSKEEKPVDDIVAFTGDETIFVDGLTRQGILKILSGAEGSVILKFSSVKVGQIRCNGFDYNPSTGATINLVKGENAVTIEFIEAINKDDATRTIIASLTKISPKTMSLTHLKIDQKRHIAYINNAPVATTDDIGLSFEMPVVKTTTNLYVLNNDMPYQWRTEKEDILSFKDDLYISSVDSVSSYGLKYIIGENGKYIILDVSDCPVEVLLKGFTESLKYTLRQNKGGESIGVINLVVGIKQIKGDRILLGSNISTFIAFEDPFKKANKKGLKTKTLSVKKLREGDSVYAELSSNVLGYSKSVLSKSYKQGQFLADMYNEEDSCYYFKSTELAPDALVQVSCIGATLNDKSMKNLPNSMIATMNIVSAQAIKLGADTGIYLFTKNSTTDSIYVDSMIVNSSGYPCVLISGNYFGSTPKAYLEYRSEKGSIKKISLPAVKSITHKRNNVNYLWKTKKVNFGNTGDGAMVFFRWPKTLNNIRHAQGGSRFDLIIDNGSLLAPMKSFANDSADIVK